MSTNSTIEWTDHTFNPWEGCQKVGAATTATRTGAMLTFRAGKKAAGRRLDGHEWNGAPS